MLPLEVLRENFFLETTHIAWLMASSPHLQSQKWQASFYHITLYFHVLSFPHVRTLCLHCDRMDNPGKTPYHEAIWLANLITSAALIAFENCYAVLHIHRWGWGLGCELGCDMLWGPLFDLPQRFLGNVLVFQDCPEKTQQTGGLSNRKLLSHSSRG